MVTNGDILWTPPEGQCPFLLVCVTTSGGKLALHEVGLWVLWLAAPTQSLAHWGEVGQPEADNAGSHTGAPWPSWARDQHRAHPTCFTL